MIAELEQIIQAEEAKPVAERDVDLIDDCIREIAELKSVRAEYTDEEIDKIMDRLVKATEQKKKRKRFIRLAAGIAAVFVIVSGVTACTVNPELINWLAKVVRMPFGNTIYSDTITYTNQGTTKEYKNIEEFLKAEELVVYFPSSLPQGVRLNSIDLFMNGGSIFYAFSFSDPAFHYTIEINYSEDVRHGELISEIDAGNLHFNVYKAKSSLVGICETDEIRYMIEHNEIESIIAIIGNLRKMEK
jgi:hypothetical protein